MAQSDRLIDKPLVTVPELGAALGITRAAVWELIKRGVLAAPCPVSTRKFVWPHEIAVALVQKVQDRRAARTRLAQVRKNMRAQKLEAQAEANLKRAAELRGGVV